MHNNCSTVILKKCKNIPKYDSKFFSMREFRSEAEFDIFCSNLNVSVDSIRDTSSYIITCNELIEYIMINNKLPPPIENKTEHFIGTILPRIVYRIITLGYLRPASDFQNFLSFLKIVGIFVAWTAVHDMYSLVLNFHCVFKPNSEFYVKNSGHNSRSCWEDVANYFIERKGIEMLIDRILRPDARIQNFDHFFTIYMHLSVEGQMNLSEELLKEPIKSLCNFFSTAILRDIEFASLNSTFTSLKKIRLLDDFDFLDQVLQFCTRCIKSELLEKEYVGADIIKMCLDMQSDHVISWFITSDLNNYLLSQVIHQNVLLKLQQVLIASMNIRMIKKFFDLSEYAIGSHKQLMLEIAANALKNQQQHEVIDFIETINDLDFLTCIIRCFSDFSMSVASIAIPKLFQVLGDRPIPQILTKYQSIKGNLVKECCKKITNPNVVAFLNQLVSHPNYEISKMIQDSIIIELQENPQNRKILFDILMSIVTTIDPIMLEMLVSFGVDDYLKGFVVLYIKKQFLKILVTCIPTLRLIISKIDFTNANEMDVRLLSSTVIIENALKEKIYVSQYESALLPTFIQLVSLPIASFSKLFNALDQCEKPEIVHKIQKSITDYFSYPKKISFKIMTVYLLSHIKLDRKCLQILHTFISSIERYYSIEDLGYKRHKTREQSEKPIEIVFLYKDKCFSLNALLSSSPDSLLKRVALHLQVDYDTIVLTYSKQFIYNYQSLKDARITEKDVIEVNDKENVETVCVQTTLPSVTLHKCRFQAKLLDLLKNSTDEQLNKTTWKLLCVLPTIEEYDFQDSNSKYVQCYRMISLLKNPDAELNYGIILNYLLTASKGISSVLRWMHDHFNKEIILQKANEVVKILLTHICSNKISFKKASIQLLIDLIQADPEIITQSISEFPDLLEKMIVIRVDSFEKYKVIYELFTDKKLLFNICMKHISENLHIVHKIFLLVVESGVVDIDIHLLMQNCISLIEITNDRIITGLCSIIVSLITSNPELIEENSKHINIFLEKAFSTSDINICKSLLSVCAALSPEKCVPYIDEKISIDSNEMNYDPDKHKKSFLGFSGLRNLGSTCYMNAVFQQLFFIGPFRKSILSYDFVEESQKKMQIIFSQLLKTKKKFCDTEPFCNVWKGWEKKLINIHEQQDAFEFLQMILDQLPSDISSLFKGTIRNTIVGDNFNSYNDESFFSIPLVVKSLKNVDESLDLFLQSELFPNYHTDDDRYIDATKSARILKTPDVLILQLKRFEYDMNIWDKIKITTPFEFKQELDINKICTEPQKKNYNLVGVVAHSGSAKGGHYVSLIRKNNDWILFNDVEVTKINGGYDFAKYTKGNETADEFTNSSAYLLFYSRLDASTEEDQVKPEILENIEKENEKFNIVQIVFSKVFLEFILKLEDTMLLLKYFINIYCFSYHGDSVTNMHSTMITSIVKNNMYQEVFDYIKAHSEKINFIYSNSRNPTIINDVTCLIIRVLYKVDINDGFEYVNNFFNLYLASIQSWSQLYGISLLFLKFVNISEEAVEIAKQNNWIDSLLMVVTIVYETLTSSAALENIDLSPIFDTLSILCCSKPNENVKQLMNLSQRILASKLHKQSFIDLITSFDEDVVQLADILPSFAKVSQELFFTMLIQIITKAKDVQSVLEIIYKLLNNKSIKITNKSVWAAISNSIHGGNVKLKKLVYENPREFVINFLIHENDTWRFSTESFVYGLFPKVKPIKNTGTCKEASSKIVPDSYRNEMDMLFYAVLDFLKLSVQQDKLLFYKEDLYEDAKLFNQEKRFKFVQVINIFEWLLVRLNHKDEETFQTLINLFIRFNSINVAMDYNLIYVAKALCRFPATMIGQYDNDIIDALLMTSMNITDSTSHYRVALEIIKVFTKMDIHKVYQYFKGESISSYFYLSIISLSGRGNQKMFNRLLNILSEPLTNQEIINFTPEDQLEEMRNISKSVIIKIFKQMDANSMNNTFRSLYIYFDEEVIKCLTPKTISIIQTFIVKHIIAKNRNVMFTDTMSDNKIIFSYAKVILNANVDYSLEDFKINYKDLIDFMMNCHDQNVYNELINFLITLSYKKIDKTGNYVIATSIRNTFQYSFEEDPSYELALAWIKFEVAYNNQFVEYLMKAYKIILQASPYASTKVLEYLDAFELNEWARAFMEQMTAIFFQEDIIETAIAIKFYRKGLKLLDSDSIIAIYACIVEQLELDDQANLIRVCLLIEAGGRDNEVFTMLFPIQDIEDFNQYGRQEFYQYIFNNGPFPTIDYKYIPPERNNKNITSRANLNYFDTAYAELDRNDMLHYPAIDYSPKSFNDPMVYDIHRKEYGDINKFVD